LQGALGARAAAEATLGVARTGQEQADGAVAQAERTRAAGEQALREAHEAVAGARGAFGEAQARVTALHEQFAEHDIAPQDALAALEAEATEAATRAALEDVERALVRLGAVNLAAADEQREVAERAEYLAAQHDDLTQALATLEQSMARMDRETRERFKETFAQVNANLARLFPRLFGGGEARLELLEDDPLNAGVALIARPPGKRNASVQALSGGEKALAALALVFALFELNPAPFCVLDEVDAPLDEHNVVRFGELVREMSARVQFVLITHNRASMEMADELTGVTMSEPGVSRLVAVDLEESLALAGAGA
jgi:chromosome segregation protein